LYPTILKSKSISILNIAKYHYRQRIDSLIKTALKTEIEKIKFFYEYLKNIFVNSLHCNVLLPQLEYFTLSLLTVRSEGPNQKIKNITTLYPFNNIKFGDKIVICGAGTFGQHLYKRILLNNNYKLVGWIDELSKYYNLLGITVDEFVQLNTWDYDSIIIAYIDESFSNLVEQKLINLGIPPNKIKSVSHFKSYSSKKLLKEFEIK